MLITLYLLLTGSAVAILVGLGIYTWMRRNLPIAKWFFLLLTLMCMRLLTYTLNVSEISLDTQILGSHIAFAATSFIGLVWLTFALALTGHARWLDRRHLLTLSVIPILLSLLSGLDATSGWFISDFRQSEFGYVEFTMGPGFIVVGIYGYVLLGIALVILARAFRGADPIQRRQYGLVILGLVTPLSVDVLFRLGVSPLPGFNLSFVSVGLTSLWLAWTVFRYRLFDVRSIAREMIVENLQDALFVVDDQDRLVDLNPVAQHWFQIHPAHGIGQPIAELFSGLPEIFAWYRRGESQGEITCRSDHSPRTYAAHAIPLRASDQRLVGHTVLFRDVTAQKHLEAERAKYFLGIEASRDPVIMSRADGIIEYVNPAFVETYGYTRAEVVGQSPRILKSGLTPPAVYATFWNALNAKQVAMVEFINQTKDGRLVTVEAMVTSILDSQGNAQNYLAVQHNVTERKRVEEALKTSEAKYRLLFENMDEGFALHEIITDATGRATDFRFLDANTAYERHTGMKPQNVIGQTILETMPQADRTRIENYGQVALTGVPLTFEYFSKTFSRHLRVRAFCPQPGKFATIFEDITERKQIEEALHASERFGRAILDGLAAHVCVLDESGTILVVNQAWRTFALANAVSSDGLGEGVNYLAVCDAATGAEAETAHAFAEGIRQVMRGERAEFLLEYPCHAPDAQRWFLVRVTRLPEATLGRVVIAHENITEIKRAEQQRQDAEKRFNAAFRSSPIGINLFRLSDGRSVDVNDAYLNSVGYSREELIGHTAEELNLFSESRERWMQSLHKPGVDSVVETTIRTKAGELRHILFSIETLDLEGESLGMVLGVDITERKRAEEQVRQLTNELQVTLDTVTAGISHLKHRQVEWANAAHDEMFGYARGATRGIETAAFYPDRASFERLGQAAYPQLWAGKTYSTEMEMQRKDGARFWCHLTGRAVDDQDPDEGSIWMIQDITERRRTEQLLRDTRENLHQFIEQSSESFILLDEQGNVIEWNHAAERNTALQREQVLGRPYWEVQAQMTLVPSTPQVTAMRKKMILDALHTGQSPLFDQSLASSVALANGESRHFEQIIFPIKTTLGFRIGAVTHELTERMHIEETLRVSEAKFRALIEQSSEAIILVDEQGYVIEWNRAQEQTSGIPRTKPIFRTLKIEYRV